MRRHRVSSLQIRSTSSGNNASIDGSRRSLYSTDIVDYSGGRNRRVSDISNKLKMLGMSNNDACQPSIDNDDTVPKNHFIEIVLATKENTKNVGWLICDGEGCIEEEVDIPFYSHVSEGGNFEHADWKDQPCVRQARITWKDDSEIAWMERHLEMTQGFILIGKNPGLMILGEPTHDREDLSEEERNFPDISRLRGYLIPAGWGMVIKKGTWHDFPVSCGPDVTVFLLNTEEVVQALMSVKSPQPMNFGDCYKLRSSDTIQDCTLRYPDPRPIARALGLLSDNANESKRVRAAASPCNASFLGYGEGMARVDLPPSWAGNDSSNVFVIPVVNVEAFCHDMVGPSVQPHLNQNQPEIANKGWREYGNKHGLRRLGNLFKRHNIPCTAVVSSDLVQNDDVMSQLHTLKQVNGWEIGAHGTNNTHGGHSGLKTEEERAAISNCIQPLETAFRTNKRMTWLTPGFRLTHSTSRLLLDAGISTLLDFVDDDKPFLLKRADEEATGKHLVCLPYSMECNDFSLILTRHLSPREYAAALESHILQLAKESQESGNPKVVCLGMHTFVAGAPAVVYELDKMLSRLQKNIIWATADRVSSIVRGRKGLTSVSSGSSSLVAGFEAQGAINDIINHNSMSHHIVTIQATPSPVKVNRSRLGLILIDMQNDFMSQDGFGESLGNDSAKLGHNIIERTKAVLQCARLAGLTIIHTREAHRPNLADLTKLKASSCPAIGKSNNKGRTLVRGAWGADFISELAPLGDDSETIIDKPGKSAFYQTDLDLVLRNANIDTLICCGVTTEVCVHSTVRDATDRGIKCIVLNDCCASYCNRFHEVGLEMISAQGGIFCSVADSKSCIDALGIVDDEKMTTYTLLSKEIHFYT